MGWMIAMAVVVAASGLSLVLWRRDQRKLAALYEAKVGRDLVGLISLLPEELRAKKFTGFALAPWTGRHLSVGLIYETDLIFRGNPPNVGLDFNPETGELVAIHPDGIGLGLK